MTIAQWLVETDVEQRDEAEALARRIEEVARGAEVSVNPHRILGFGRGADNYPLVAIAVRRDGLRLYANVGELSRHKAVLGKKLTGKSCVTLKRAADIDDDLLGRIVTASLSARAIAQG